jgi:CheY-like chemotaxis protein
MRTRKRVLVVDDCPDSAESLTLLIQLWGHEVRSVPDGPTALATAQQHQLDVVLLDLGLPGMDGWTVARQLRASDRGRHILLVALTGFGSEKDQQACQEAGFDFYFLKPVEPEDLRQLLEEAPSQDREDQCLAPGV